MFKLWESPAFGGNTTHWQPQSESDGAALGIRDRQLADSEARASPSLSESLLRQGKSQANASLLATACPRRAEI